MTDNVRALIQHGNCRFLCQRYVCKGFAVSNQHLGIGIRGLCAQLKRLDRLDDGRLSRTGYKANNPAFRKPRRQISQEVTALLVGYLAGKNIIRFHTSFKDNEVRIRILACHTERRIAKLEAQSKNQIIALRGIVGQSCFHISCLQIFGIREVDSILVLRGGQSVISQLAPAAVVGRSGQTERNL